MLKAGIGFGVFSPRGMDQLDSRSRGRRASGETARAARVFGGEGCRRVVGRGRGRGSSEYELIRRKARTLVGLKHEFRPPVLGGQRQVRVHDAARVVDEPELWLLLR